MTVELLRKFADHVEALTTADIDALAAAFGFEARALCHARQVALFTKAAPSPRLEGLASSVVEVIAKTIAPLKAEIHSLKTENAALNDRVLSLEATVASRSKVDA